MTDITLPQAAGAILDGIQRTITPLSHAELIAVNKECQRLRQKRYNIYCKDRDLDTFEIQQGLRIKRLNRARAEAEKRRR